MRDDEAFADEEMEPDPELNRITNAIIGAAIAVHRELGPGQLESCYEKSLAIEMSYRGIPFERQAPVLLMYRMESKSPTAAAMRSFWRWTMPWLSSSCTMRRRRRS
jgi:hypothetical protein